MTPRTRAFVVAAMLLAGCGGSGPGIPDTVGNQLVMRVAAIQAAAGRADRSATDRSVSELLTAVDRFVADGEITPDTAARIRRAAAEVRARVALLPAPTTTTTTTTTTPEDERGSGKSSGKRHGKD